MKRAVIMAALAFAVVWGLPAVLQAQAEKAPDTVILKGAPTGGVKFDHAKHQKLAGNKCETCHHPSKPEKALKTPHEKCADCHTKTVAAPMKTKAQAAFHDPTAKKGTCIDCHQKAGAGKAPLKCNECHKKENA